MPKSTTDVEGRDVRKRIVYKEEMRLIIESVILDAVNDLIDISEPKQAEKLVDLITNAVYKAL